MLTICALHFIDAHQCTLLFCVFYIVIKINICLYFCAVMISSCGWITNLHNSNIPQLARWPCRTPGIRRMGGAPLEVGQCRLASLVRQWSSTQICEAWRIATITQCLLHGETCYSHTFLRCQVNYCTHLLWLNFLMLIDACMCVLLPKNTSRPFFKTLWKIIQIWSSSSAHFGLHSCFYVIFLCCQV